MKSVGGTEFSETEKDAVSKFPAKQGFSQFIGVVDGTHIFAKRPSLNSTGYLHRKNRFSFNVQAMCDLSIAGISSHLLPLVAWRVELHISL